MPSLLELLSELSALFELNALSEFMMRAPPKRIRKQRTLTYIMSYNREKWSGEQSSN